MWFGRDGGREGRRKDEGRDGEREKRAGMFLQDARLVLRAARFSEE